MKSMANITSLLVCTTLFLAGGCDKAVKENIAEKTNPSFLKLAKDRFSVRYYAKKPVEKEKIDAKQVAAAFDIPENLTPSFLLDVGYPANGVAPAKPHFEKRDINDFTTYK